MFLLQGEQPRIFGDAWRFGTIRVASCFIHRPFHYASLWLERPRVPGLIAISNASRHARNQHRDEWKRLRISDFFSPFFFSLFFFFRLLETIEHGRIDFVIWFVFESHPCWGGKLARGIEKVSLTLVDLGLSWQRCLLRFDIYKSLESWSFVFFFYRVFEIEDFF